MAKRNAEQALDLFETARKANPYLYFELAYTRQTAWMCWVIDKTGGGRDVLVRHQGDTPDDAAAGAISVLTKLALCAG